MDWLNIFKFMENGVSTSNPLHPIINPIVDFLHGLNTIGLLVITLLLGIMLTFFVSGIGKASNRAAYLGSRGGKILVSLIAITLVPFMVGAFLASYANMVQEAGSSSGIQSKINEIPREYIVNTEGYIGGSLDGAIGSSAKAAKDGKIKTLLKTY